MTLGRLFAILIVLLVGWWVLTRSGLFRQPAPAETSQAPIERAREVARKSTERAWEVAGKAAEGAPARAGPRAPAAPPPPGGTVSENMPPDRVPALPAPPPKPLSETPGPGARREKWIYSSVNKTVVFENGVV